MKQDIIAHLKEMLELTDDETGEYIDAFMQSFDECCEELKNQENGELDYSQLRVVTHTLIGFSENMGAADLAAEAKSLNTAAKAQDVDNCRRLIGDILRLQQSYHTE